MQCLEDSEYEDSCCAGHYGTECSDRFCKDPKTYLYLPKPVPFETKARKLEQDRMSELEADFSTHRIEGVTNEGNFPISTPLFTQLTDSLWMGGTPATDPAKHLPGFFMAVLNLYRWEPYLMWSDTAYHEIEMYDTSTGADMDKVDALADWVLAHAKLHHTLVHCQAGLNRSGLVTGAALCKMGYSVDDAIMLMRYKRSPAVLINAKIEAQLRERYG